jgi:dipeptidyl aminopeptidase/acylaminoacyl peptidase
VFGSDAEECRKASPLTHVKGKKPPFLLVHADNDYPTLAFFTRQMGSALRRQKTEATTLEIKGRTHVSLIVRVANEDDPTTQAMLAFIARHAGLKLMPKRKP